MGECLIVRKGSQPEGTATTGDVLSGVTFQSANSDDLQTGTLSLTGNAGTANVLSGKTFYNTNAKSKQTGTMTNRSNSNPDATAIAVANNKYLRYTVPQGYYENSCLDTLLTNLGNASASDVLSGKTFTSSAGLKVSGTMTNRGAVSATISAGGSYTIPAGYHNGSGKVSTPCGYTITHGSSVTVVNGAKYAYCTVCDFNSGYASSVYPTFSGVTVNSRSGAQFTSWKLHSNYTLRQDWGEFTATSTTFTVSWGGNISGGTIALFRIA